MWDEALKCPHLNPLPEGEYVFSALRYTKHRTSSIEHSNSPTPNVELRGSD